VCFLRASIVLGVLALAAPASAAAALSLEPVNDGGYDSPLHVTGDPADPDRLFVVEQDGRIRLTEGGSTSTFLDIDSIVQSAGEMPGGNEEGLLSMAFSPDYVTDGLFYVVYTGTDSDLHIAEFDATGPGAIEDTRREVLEIPHPGHDEHHGGQLQLGPDGYLYVSTGDGGGQGDPEENAQDLSSLLGKILRIDPAGSSPGEYLVPADNPFAGTVGCGPAPDGCDEIWSYGLRNPWRFSFDRQAGSLVIGDVGGNAWEEVDFDPGPNPGRADNFGWDCFEGLHVFEAGTDPACTGPTFTDPVHEYAHLNGNCSIIGGYVVRDPSLGDLYGRYLYADLCTGELRSLSPGLPLASCDRSEGLDVDIPTSFGEDADGRIYVAERAGTVSRLSGQAESGGCSSPSFPPGSPPAMPSDASPPDLELEAQRRQSIEGSLRVRVRVDEPANVVLRARVRAGEGAAFGLGREASSLEAGAEEKLKWKLSRREARRVRGRIEHGRDASARVTGKATDTAGNTSGQRSRSVQLVR